MRSLRSTTNEFEVDFENEVRYLFKTTSDGSTTGTTLDSTSTFEHPVLEASTVDPSQQSQQ